jgi:hypothetical protein
MPAHPRRFLECGLLIWEDAVIGSAVELITGVILFVAAIAALLAMRPGADGQPRPIAKMRLLETVIPVTIVASFAIGLAMVVAAAFPIFVK